MKDIGVGLEEAFRTWTSGEVVVLGEIIRQVVVIFLPYFVFGWVEAAVEVGAIVPVHVVTVEFGNEIISGGFLEVW